MSVNIHSTVCHKLYGKGVVLKITSDKIYVLFGKKQRIFPYPEAFGKGYLSSSNKENAKVMIKEDIYNKKKDLTSVKTVGETRESILDAAENIHYTTIYEAINGTVGSNYTGWMQATWPRSKHKVSFWIWFPKLAETKDNQLVSAALNCINMISEDWNEFIYDDLSDTPPENEKDENILPVLIFAKEPKGGPYVFRGVFLKSKEKSEAKHHVYNRIGTKVRLTGQPSEKIEILDDFRKRL